MHFIPIPSTKDALERSEPLWLPLLSRIAERSIETPIELHHLIMSGQVQIGIIWDDDKNKALALIGMQTRKAGKEIIGEIHWAAGWGMKDWRHLLPEVERYLKDIRCTISKPICRPGWKRLLTQAGYKQTHVMMEKVL